MGRTNKLRDVAFQKIGYQQLKECLYGIPLLTLPLCNLIMTKNHSISVSFGLWTLCVAIAEELFFRGFLYDLLAKWNKWGYVMISSLLFGVFHFVNIWEGKDGIYVYMQVLCAFAAGVSYAALVVQCGSIFPCILAHFFTNISVGKVSAMEFTNSFTYEMSGLWSCIILYAAYGLWLCKKENRRGSKNGVLY
uniref:CPBP family intramembrane glutamic endopeptidase n=1 Tax=Agathobacter sp. TaxID=2021311 RepID=UPI0040577A67